MCPEYFVPACFPCADLLLSLRRRCSTAWVKNTNGRGRFRKPGVVSSRNGSTIERLTNLFNSRTGSEPFDDRPCLVPDVRCGRPRTRLCDLGNRESAPLSLFPFCSPEPPT